MNSVAFALFVITCSTLFLFQQKVEAQPSQLKSAVVYLSGDRTFPAVVAYKNANNVVVTCENIMFCGSSERCRGEPLTSPPYASRGKTRAVCAYPFGSDVRSTQLLYRNANGPNNCLPANVISQADAPTCPGGEGK